MKLQIARILGALFLPKGYPRALYNSTFDDTQPPMDTDIAIIVQALLGSSPTIAPDEAQCELAKRLKLNWTWKVVLKALMIYHSLLITPRASAAWLKNFFTINDSLFICQSFREGEGVDPEAESHSPLIRRYALYLTLLIKRRTLESNILPWDTFTCNLEFHDKDHDELFYIIEECTLLLSKCLAPFILNSEIVIVSKFSLLTAALCNALLKDALLFHRQVSSAIKELINRFASLHEFDSNTALAVYKKYFKASNDFHKFVQFFKISAELVQYPFSSFQDPSPTFDIPEIELSSSSKYSAVSVNMDALQTFTKNEKSLNQNFTALETLSLLDDQIPTTYQQTSNLETPKVNKPPTLPKVKFEQKIVLEKTNLPSSSELISNIPLPVYPHPTHSSINQYNDGNPSLASSTSLSCKAEKLTTDLITNYDLFETLKEPAENIAPNNNISLL